MRCPYCLKDETKVLDSRGSEDAIRRRRECEQCSKRFTTYERVEIMDISVVKKDGKVETFDRDKILKGVQKAFEKRPIKQEKIDQIVSSIEARIRNSDKTEIKSKKIGAMVMEELQKHDEVAYIRFASVHKKFRDADQFVKAVNNLKTEA
ncbi:transcriptional regulator NrdR [Candidatus Woesearchaeota archaeon]|nr:transcriptional regulator NrdR [Candidatus Woesearchaeota archaeon]